MNNEWWITIVSKIDLVKKVFSNECHVMIRVAPDDQMLYLVYFVETWSHY